MARKVFMIGRDEIPASVSLGAGEKLDWTLVCLPGTSAVVDLAISLDGPGAELDLAGLYLCPGSENVRMNVSVRHNSGGCISHQLFKGIVGGTARAEFDGLIYVARDAQKTKAYQQSHSILLSAGAWAESKPQLEIYADDVECSHGATTGFLGENELFYMRSRGIPEKDARRLQIISFLSPVLERLPEELRDDIISEC